MNIIIVGGGKVGAALANELREARHKVTLVEIRRDQCRKLAEEVRAECICGDGCEPDVLDKAGVRKANVVIAVTGHDEDNLVVCLLGKFEYEVPLIIARINNPKNAWLFTKRFGVDVPVSNTELISKVLLEQLTLGDIVTLLKLRKGDMALLEITLKKESAVVGKEIADLRLPPDCVFVSIIRDGQLILPRGKTRLAAHDELLVITHVSNEAILVKLLS